MKRVAASASAYFAYFILGVLLHLLHINLWAKCICVCLFVSVCFEGTRFFEGSSKKEPFVSFLLLGDVSLRPLSSVEWHEALRDNGGNLTQWQAGNSLDQSTTSARVDTHFCWCERWACEMEPRNAIHLDSQVAIAFFKAIATGDPGAIVSLCTWDLRVSRGFSSLLWSWYFFGGKGGGMHGIASMGLAARQSCDRKRASG